MKMQNAEKQYFLNYLPMTSSTVGLLSQTSFKLWHKFFVYILSFLILFCFVFVLNHIASSHIFLPFSFFISSCPPPLKLFIFHYLEVIFFLFVVFTKILSKRLISHLNTTHSSLALWLFPHVIISLNILIQPMLREQRGDNGSCHQDEWVEALAVATSWGALVKML
jgi:hypothetical protein